jgi:hypothetical protein
MAAELDERLARLQAAATPAEKLRIAVCIATWLKGTRQVVYLGHVLLCTKLANVELFHDFLSEEIAATIRLGDAPITIRSIMTILFRAGWVGSRDIMELILRGLLIWRESENRDFIVEHAEKFSGARISSDYHRMAESYYCDIRVAEALHAHGCRFANDESEKIVYNMIKKCALKDLLPVCDFIKLHGYLVDSKSKTTKVIIDRIGAELNAILPNDGCLIRTADIINRCTPELIALMHACCQAYPISAMKILRLLKYRNFFPVDMQPIPKWFECMYFCTRADKLMKCVGLAAGSLRRAEFYLLMERLRMFDRAKFSFTADDLNYKEDPSDDHITTNRALCISILGLRRLESLSDRVMVFLFMTRPPLGIPSAISEVPGLQALPTDLVVLMTHYLYGAHSGCISQAFELLRMIGWCHSDINTSHDSPLLTSEKQDE